MTAGVFVDYLGDGNLTEIFQSSLQLCYMQGEIGLPTFTPNSQGRYVYRFSLPSGLTNPFIYTDANAVNPNIDTYFIKVSATEWDLHLESSRYISKPLQRVVIRWLTTVNANEIKIYYGGYRG